MVRLLKIIIIPALFALSSCDHDVKMKTEVREDGSLAKTIRFSDADTANATTNHLGISAASGWAVESEKIAEGEKSELQLIFRKEFASVAEANSELNQPVDTLFQIESTFAREFRWFYTYISYSETFKSIDRFRYVDKQNYFTEEDFAFIKRLPGLGAPVSTADSLASELLNEKIYDIYGARGMFEEIYHFWEESFRKYGKDLSVLTEHREMLFHLLTDDDRYTDIDDDYPLFEVFDSLGVDFPTEALTRDYDEFNASFEAYLEMASWAGDGRFVNTIEMPWKIVETNADSLENNVAVWRPSPFKYLLNDYTMHATARKMNTWAVVLSGLIVAFTLALGIRSLLRGHKL